jgi:hypothetical protein
MQRVFLSYSHKDRPFAERLASDLAKNDIIVWYDEWEMKPGDSLVRKVSEGIMSSGSMLVLLSESSASSRWVQKEFSIALCDSLAKRDVKIVPILLEDCTFPKSFHFLGDIIYADFRSDYDDALRRLLSALSVRPSRHGIKSYKKDLQTLKVTRPAGIEVACWEGLEMIWQFDSLTGTVEFLLKHGARVTRRPLLSIPVTKIEAYKLRHLSERGGWGYYDLVEPVGPYRSCVRITYYIEEPDYANLVWLIDSKRRRTLRIRWDQFSGEPLFEGEYE